MSFDTGIFIRRVRKNRFEIEEVNLSSDQRNDLGHYKTCEEALTALEKRQDFLTDLEGVMYEAIYIRGFIPHVKQRGTLKKNKK